MENELKNQNRKLLLDAIFIPFILVLFMVLTFIFERGMDLDFHKAGIYPRSIKNLYGIFTYVFIHADIKHLVNNIFSFFVLSVSLFYFYKPLALPILFYSHFLSGILLWIIGRDSWHIGASGLIYAIAFFLFFSGLIRKHIPLIAISLFVTFLYGSMVWGVFPWLVKDTVSWEGHLAGSLSGLFLALIFFKSGPQKPEKIWEEDDDEDDDFYKYDFDTENSVNSIPGNKI